MKNRKFYILSIALFFSLTLIPAGKLHCSDFIRLKETPNLVLGADFGAILLKSPVGDEFEPGPAVGAHVEYFLTDNWTLKPAVLFSFHNDVLSETIVTEPLKLISFDFGIIYNLIIENTTLYFGVGPGFSYHFFGGALSKSIISFAANPMAGLKFLITEKMALGMGYKYHFIVDRDIVNDLSGATITGSTDDYQSFTLLLDFYL